MFGVGQGKVMESGLAVVLLRLLGRGTRKPISKRKAKKTAYSVLHTSTVVSSSARKEGTSSAVEAALGYI